MQVRLEVAHRNANHKKVVLKSDTLIGRSADCNLRIASKEVSRKHCQVTLSESGVMVRDLGSANGTFVNGYKLDTDVDYAVAPDSELSVGGIKFVVRFELPAGSPTTPGSTVDLHQALDGTADPPETVAEQAPTEPAPAETVFDESQAAADEFPLGPLDDEADLEPLTAEADDDQTEAARFVPDSPDTVFEDADAVGMDVEPPTQSELDEAAEFEYVVDPGNSADEDITADELTMDADDADESELPSDADSDELLTSGDEEDFDFQLAETQDMPIVSDDEVDDVSPEDEDEELGDFLKRFDE